MKRLNKEMTANEIWDEWKIPRGLLKVAANAPCPIRVAEEVSNGVCRKKYMTADVVEYFHCDMTNRTIDGGDDEPNS